MVFGVTMNMWKLNTIWVLAKRELRTTLVGKGIYFAIMTSLLISSVILGNYLGAISRDGILITADPLSYPFFIATTVSAIYLALSSVTAIAREKDRRKRVRWPALALVLAAGVFELLLLWRRSKLSRAELEAHIAKAGGDSEGESGLAPEQARSIAGSMPVVWLIVMTGGLALAFVILAAVALYA